MESGHFIEQEELRKDQLHFESSASPRATCHPKTVTRALARGAGLTRVQPPDAVTVTVKLQHEFWRNVQTTAPYQVTTNRIA